MCSSWNFLGFSEKVEFMLLLVWCNVKCFLISVVLRVMVVMVVLMFMVWFDSLIL